MKMIMRFLKDYKKECVLAPLFKMLEAIFELFVPLVVSSVIDRGIVNADKGYIMQMIFGVNTLPAYRNHGYAGELLKRAIADAKDQGRKGLVLTCKDRLVHYYAKFGFENEGVSESVHGNVVWNQMRLKF